MSPPPMQNNAPGAYFFEVDGVQHPLEVLPPAPQARSLLISGGRTPVCRDVPYEVEQELTPEMEREHQYELHPLEVAYQELGCPS